MQSAVSIHPQVLFNISSHVLTNHVNNSNSVKENHRQLGLLLGIELWNLAKYKIHFRHL